MNLTEQEKQVLQDLIRNKFDHRKSDFHKCRILIDIADKLSLGNDFYEEMKNDFEQYFKRDD